MDVDPVDLKPYLKAGRNVIGVEVLFYGHPEGTWPGGQPGLIVHLTAVEADGHTTVVTTDKTWDCQVDRTHRPGQYRRWFLRSLQEDRDEQLRPEGWDTPRFQVPRGWSKAAEIECPADKPSGCRSDRHWSADSVDRIDPAKASLRRREIPLSREVMVKAEKLVAFDSVRWKRPPEDWFDLRMADSFETGRPAEVSRTPEGSWLVDNLFPTLGQTLTFELEEQVTGWPFFTIQASAGTVIELMVQESRDPKSPWLDSHFFAWTRFTCREGVNRFECFDYESLRFIQLHVRNAARAVKISDVGVRRKLADWAAPARIVIGEPALQRLMDASLNTLNNCAIETVVDGMGRERQQYSGDCGHVMHALRYAFGEQRIPRRYLRTWSEGLTRDGYFLDCWPASDRLARVAQRQIDGASWGPLIDHGVGFGFDCWNHYWETGDAAALTEAYPRLLRFAAYLESIRREGLLPVEDLGVPAVWMDHTAYRRQRDKGCSFNLYAAAMLRDALAPLAERFGDAGRALALRRLAAGILAAAQKRFWSAEQKAYVDNLPWIAEDGGPRFSDRTLATALLHGLNPLGQDAASVRLLVERPENLGLSYPANSGWRMWALAKANRIDVVLKEWRERWATMRSVKENNTLSEFWDPKPGTTNEWSHCPVAPLYVLFQEVVGLRATAPGFAKALLKPQLGDLASLDVTAHLPQGPLTFAASRTADGHDVKLTVPQGVELTWQGKVLGPGAAEISVRR
jgi:hypothetical protein